MSDIRVIAVRENEYGEWLFAVEVTASNLESCIRAAVVENFGFWITSSTEPDIGEIDTDDLHYLGNTLTVAVVPKSASIAVLTQCHLAIDGMRAILPINGD